MASIASHAVIGVAIGVTFMPRSADRRYVLLGAASAVLPDLDTLGSLSGFSGDDLFAHRGLSHSIVLGVFVAAVVSFVVSRLGRWRTSSRRLFLCVSMAMISHGLVDTMTTYGRGVALLAPFSNERFASPFRPLGTTGLEGQHSRTERIAALVLNEVVWLWLPATTLALAVLAKRRYFDERIRNNARATPSTRH